jgi:hypothetical protein
MWSPAKPSVLAKALYIKVAKFCADLANCQQRERRARSDTDSRKSGGGLCGERERERYRK